MIGGDIIAGVGLTLEAIKSGGPLMQLQSWLTWALLRVDRGRDLEPFAALTLSDRAEVADVAQALYHALMAVREARIGEGEYFSEAERVLYVYGERLLDAPADAVVALSPDTVEAQTRAVDLRTELWLRQLATKLLAAPAPYARVWRKVAHVAALAGKVARALLHVREARAEPEAVVVLSMDLARAVWVALGTFVHVTPEAMAALVANELQRARDKWPGNTLRTVVLAEHVGKFCGALAGLDADLSPDTLHDLTEEAVEAIAMACRVATEGDSTVPAYDPGACSSAVWLS